MSCVFNPTLKEINHSCKKPQHRKHQESAVSSRRNKQKSSLVLLTCNLSILLFLTQILNYSVLITFLQQMNSLLCRLITGTEQVFHGLWCWEKIASNHYSSVMTAFSVYLTIKAITRSSRKYLFSQSTDLGSCFRSKGVWLSCTAEVWILQAD